MMGFLPITLEEINNRNWDRPDFIFVIGDAYVDHSSFGPAIISRVLESRGYKVAIISQPDINDPTSIMVLGEPRLGFLVSSGNMDSMVNHYTVNKKKRKQDAYSPGGISGKRPDRATIVYSNLIRNKFPNVPIIIGGIEASLRRLTHYDYWSNTLMRSILIDSKADLLIYGMGELQIIEIADSLNSGIDISDINFVNGTVYKTYDIQKVEKPFIELPSYKQMLSDKIKYAKSFNLQYINANFGSSKKLVERYQDSTFIVQNPPARPLTTQEMDDIYELPYMNAFHPIYNNKGGVPAIDEVRFSLTSSRGCFGGCSFCSLSFHQGRIVQSRSHESLIREAIKMTKDPLFKGYINDVGGPTANFRNKSCEKQSISGVCSNRQCLFPTPCKNIIVDHSDYFSLLSKLRNITGVKKVFIRSGIRYDYLMQDKYYARYLNEICKYHVSGQLRVAPEHVSNNVLSLMGKPSYSVYKKFCSDFSKISKKNNKEQYVLPYLMSSHPGSTLKDAVQLAEAVKELHFQPEQVQDFYPTPSTLSTCMFYTGIDPRTMKQIYVAKTQYEKQMQRALIQYNNPSNRYLVIEALKKAGRIDLIGNDNKHCLINDYSVKCNNKIRHIR